MEDIGRAACRHCTNHRPVAVVYFKKTNVLAKFVLAKYEIYLGVGSGVRSV